MPKFTLKFFLLAQLIVALICFNIEGLEYDQRDRKDIFVQGKLAVRLLSYRTVRVNTRYNWPAPYLDVVSDEMQLNSDRPVTYRLRFIQVGHDLYWKSEFRMEKHPCYLGYAVLSKERAIRYEWPPLESRFRQYLEGKAQLSHK
jgi:hypothetical protein